VRIWEEECEFVGSFVTSELWATKCYLQIRSEERGLHHLECFHGSLVSTDLSLVSQNVVGIVGLKYSF
jgi:hypothetical protein